MFISHEVDVYAMFLVFDALLFGLTLFKTLSLRHNGLNTPLVSLLMRDGIIYFLYVHDIPFWSLPSDVEPIQYHVPRECYECRPLRGT
jgi:hypothetical protein